MKIIISIASLLLCFGLFEGALRLHFAMKGESVVFPTTHDEALVWRPSVLSKAPKRPNLYGTAAISYWTNEKGFRGYPEKHDPNKKTLFIVGDSYTQALQVNQEEPYYHFLKSKFNVYAIGADGYGTYQEYLTIERYYKELNPDYVILQFCSNDIINNSYELTNMDYQNVTDYNRNFLLNGEVKSHRELSWAFNLSKVFGWFRSTQFIEGKILKIRARMNPVTLEEKIRRRLIPKDLLKKEGVHTGRILEKILSLVGREKLYIFNVSSPGPLFNFYKSEVARLKIRSLDEAVKKVYAQKDVLAEDGAHYNAKGHRILGNAILGMLYPP